MKLRSEILLAGIAMSLAAAPAVAMPHGKPGLWTIVSTMKMANMPDLPPEVLAMMKKRGTPGMGQPTTTQMCMTDEQVKAGDVLKNERPDCTTKVISQTATSATTEVTCKGEMAGTGRSTINWRGDTHYEGSYSFNGSIQGQANAMSTSYTGDFVKPDCGAVKPFNAKNMAMPRSPPARAALMQDGAAALAALLRGSHRAVVFTGAGMSTESGIPDFRSPGGIWTKMMPVEFQDYLADPQARRVSWQRRFEMEETWNAVAPNDGHKAVAELVARGVVSHIITQNIDALHQAAGVPDEKVIELHGNTRHAKCLDCESRIEIADIRAHFDQHGDAPDCVQCGGIVKTATISFGQPMPESEMARAHAATMACDLMLVLGSSLAVYPAAGFPLLAKKNAALLAIVNREPTPQDSYADLVLHTEIGPTIRAVIDAL